VKKSNIWGGSVQ